jgi:hypothetical protein
MKAPRCHLVLLPVFYNEPVRASFVSNQDFLKILPITWNAWLKIFVELPDSIGLNGTFSCKGIDGCKKASCVIGSGPQADARHSSKRYPSGIRP